MSDCVYNEEIVDALLCTAAALSTVEDKTLCIVSLELRCGAPALHASITEAEAAAVLP